MAEYQINELIIKKDYEHMRAYERFKRPVYHQQKEQEKEEKWHEINSMKQECKE